MKVRIADITLAEDINIRQELREEAVERYAEILDEMPPVSLWKPNGKLLLTDGWHRIAAAQRLGRTEIEAEVHEGDRTEAIVAAIVANTRHGIPLSLGERIQAVGRLSKAGWSARQIARELGLSRRSIREDIESGRLGAHPTAVEAIRAPREYRLPVAEAATRGGWTQRETREVAQRLADPRVPEDEKRAIVARYMEPREDGRMAVSGELVAAALRQAREQAAAPAIYGFLAAAAELMAKLAIDPDPLDGIDPADFSELRRGLDRAEQAIERVRMALEARS